MKRTLSAAQCRDVVLVLYVCGLALLTACCYLVRYGNW